MASYLYSNLNLFGAAGISDYAFVCIIDGSDEDEALAWGNEIAKAYDARYGLMPSGDRLTADEIVRHGSIKLNDNGTVKEVKLRCNVGEMPNLLLLRPTAPPT